MIDKTFKPADIYFDADSGGVGLLGFMEGQKPAPGVPQDVIPTVSDLISQMKAGKFTRFSVFSGPIKDNKGNIVVPAGATLTQSDLEGIDETIAKQTGREPCKYCMNWLAEGISPDATIPSSQ